MLGLSVASSWLLVTFPALLTHTGHPTRVPGKPGSKCHSHLSQLCDLGLVTCLLWASFLMGKCR